MKAVHLKLVGLYDQYEEALAEMVVRLLDGVKDVAAVRSLHLISVLYDERTASIPKIIASMRRAGVKARIYRPSISGTPRPALGSRSGA